MRRVWLALVLSLFATAASADESKLVAVLPLTNSQTTLSPQAIIALQESIRTKAGDVLVPLGYRILTNETMLEVMRDNGVNPEKVCEASCALEAGRELKARYILSGAITTDEGRHAVFVRFFDVTTGAMLSSIKLVGTDGRALEDAFDAKADELFAKARLTGAEAVPGTLVVSANIADADVSIDGRPQGQRVAPDRAASFDLKPGTHQLKVSKTGYFEFLSTVEIRPRERQSVQAKLEQETQAPTPSFTGGVTTMLTVEADPREALIRIDGKPVGRGLVSTRVAPGEHQVEAASDLYAPTQQRVTLQAGDVRKLTLALKPTFGRLEVTSNPSGALVYLDDRQLGTAAPTLAVPRITSGTYRVRLTLADHYDDVQQITIRDGETTKVTSHALRPSVGTLRLSSSPSGAKVIIDGTERGTTPLVVDRLAGGAHELRLELPDYRALTTTAAVTEGAETPGAFTLEPAFAPLSIAATAVPSTVLVDGKNVGNTPLNNARLAEGEHVVRVVPESPSYRPWEQRVTAVAGTPVSLAAELRPILGRLLVVTTPPGAAVFIDGREIGQAPVAVSDILAGPHELRTVLHEHREEIRTIDVAGDRETALDIALTELLPAEKAAERVAQWERDTAGRRALVWGAGGVTVALAGLSLWQVAMTSHHASTRDSLYATYLSTKTDASKAYDQYAAENSATGRARTLSAVFGIGAGVMAAGTAVLWLTLPARPSFEIAGSGGSISVEGQW